MSRTERGKQPDILSEIDKALGNKPQEKVAKPDKAFELITKHRIAVFSVAIRDEGILTKEEQKPLGKLKDESADLIFDKSNDQYWGRSLRQWTVSLMQKSGNMSNRQVVVDIEGFRVAALSLVLSTNPDVFSEQMRERVDGMRERYTSLEKSYQERKKLQNKR
jgi:hypothetical protein